MYQLMLFLVVLAIITAVCPKHPDKHSPVPAAHRQPEPVATGPGEQGKGHRGVVTGPTQQRRDHYHLLLLPPLPWQHHTLQGPQLLQRH